jgi:hypothetical protein
VKQAVRDQEKKIGHSCGRVAVSLQRVWTRTGVSIADRFAGINVAFAFLHDSGHSQALFTEQRFFLVSHASSGEKSYSLSFSF